MLKSLLGIVRKWRREKFAILPVPGSKIALHSARELQNTRGLGREHTFSDQERLIFALFSHSYGFCDTGTDYKFF